MLSLLRFKIQEYLVARDNVIVVVAVFIISTIKPTSTRGDGYADLCVTNSDCSPRMECINNFCVCQPNYNTMQVYNITGYNRTECIVKASCSKDSRFIPSWCGSSISGFCIDGICDCLGTIVVVDLLHRPRRKLRPVDYVGHCIRTFKGMGSFCTYFKPCNGHIGLVCHNNKKCLCKDSLIYDFKTNKCTGKQQYMMEHGLTEYKVTHGTYCLADEDCLIGLECSFNFSCSCAAPCDSYIKERQSCDCGNPYPHAPIMQISLGVSLGGASVVFWCVCTVAKCTMAGRREHEDELSMESDENGGTGFGVSPDHRQIVRLPPEHVYVAPSTSSHYRDDDPPPSYNEVMSISITMSSNAAREYQSLPPDYMSVEVASSNKNMSMEVASSNKNKPVTDNENLTSSASCSSGTANLKI